MISTVIDRFNQNTTSAFLNTEQVESLTLFINEHIKAENEKHLIMHFPEIKEAFYAKCTLLIEGETEYGCIHAFAEKVGVSLDEYGICVINAGGEKSIKPIRKLLGFLLSPHSHL